jgi:phospholipid/cholesterol/gamma-HCH transport system permease protein
MPSTSGTDAAPDLARASIDGESWMRATGDWTLPHVQRLAERIDTLGALDEADVRLDFSGVTRLDASGALMLERLTDVLGIPEHARALPERWRRVFEAVDSTCDAQPAEEDDLEPAWRQVLERIGRATVEVLQSTRELFGFLGLTLHRLARSIVQPRRLRLTSVVHHIEQTGLDAAPLLMLLAALIGAVIAFLGATVLADFGAQLFVVDLVAFAFAREFGVLLTAILLAGRTASAFCAQIGMMKSREEIDAIRTLGLDTTEVLVLPRLIALLIALPLLAFLATLAGLAGGLVVSVVSLDINLSLYLERVQETLTLRQYLIGMIKAPIFALVIALIGCLEGLRVSGTAQSVGERTTTAVVRSITMVIVIDAIAAVYFMEIGW